MVSNPLPEWDDVYLDLIKVIESQLGYEICGYPVGPELKPCRRIPVDDSGRCEKHGGKIDSTIKKAIINRKMKFLKCDNCDLQEHCQFFSENSICSIEVEMYNNLWSQIESAYDDIHTDPTREILTDELIRSLIRKDRAWRFENAFGMRTAEQEKITVYDKRIHEQIIKYMDKLGMPKKQKEKPKDIFKLMEEVSE